MTVLWCINNSHSKWRTRMQKPVIIILSPTEPHWFIRELLTSVCYLPLRHFLSEHHTLAAGVKPISLGAERGREGAQTRARLYHIHSARQSDPAHLQKPLWCVKREHATQAPPFWPGHPDSTASRLQFLRNNYTLPPSGRSEKVSLSEQRSY